MQDILERLKFKDGYNPPSRRERVLRPSVRGRIRSLAFLKQLQRLEISLACMLGGSARDQIQLADVFAALTTVPMSGRQRTSSTFDPVFVGPCIDIR